MSRIYIINLHSPKKTSLFGKKYEHYVKQLIPYIDVKGSSLVVYNDRKKITMDFVRLVYKFFIPKHLNFLIESYPIINTSKKTNLKIKKLNKKKLEVLLEKLENEDQTHLISANKDFPLIVNSIVKRDRNNYQMLNRLITNPYESEQYSIIEVENRKITNTVKIDF